MVQTSKAFVVSLTPNLKEYSVIEIAPMKKTRAGHGLVYHTDKKMVFAVGGFSSEDSFSRSAEVYSLESREWFQLDDLKIERSKPTAFVYNENLYVFGGLTTNSKIYDSMGETFNFKT